MSMEKKREVAINQLKEIIINEGLADVFIETPAPPTMSVGLLKEHRTQAIRYVSETKGLYFVINDRAISSDSPEVTYADVALGGGSMVDVLAKMQMAITELRMEINLI